MGIGGNDTKLIRENLKQMIDESDPKLPFGYIKLDEEGYAVSRSHIASNAIKTNCPMAVSIRIAKELQQC
ncbi:hypothetical protein AAG906_029373 [Vitis piasezkii]